MRIIFAYLGRQSKLFLIASSLIMLVGFGVIDYLTGDEVIIFLFYTIPISLTAWFVGRAWGILMCFLSAMVWFASDWLLGYNLGHTPVHLWNATVGMGYFLAITYAFVALKEALERERELSRTDSLTGIANGKYFYELAEDELYRSQRYNHPLTLAYLDLDDFKGVNDEYGHSEGDALLRLIATTLRKHLRLTDMVARLGGDEFAILLPETGFEQASIVMDQLRSRLTESMPQGKRHLPPTFSVGVVTNEDHEGTVDELIKIADGLMYAAKNKGKDRVEFGRKARKSGQN